ncbi:LrgB family protein [Alkaliphilus sp. B6464]|uniref:LrgB family protein n=1 Tax=Alkaliphilus sp. B6464 TaxID=2731219 RepID=UPI001BA62683|nr:LrgB family protein [Alkaliphilus sp. B6464]QUH18968.1 LrgB family protein [Alkaliphilus sp. B6464]
MELLNTPVFGILLSIISFEIGGIIYKRTKLAVFNPLFVSIILSIVFLLSFNIDVEVYEKGGSFINFFLGPATVILAVPLYKQIDLLKSNLIPILGGILAGSLTAIVSVWALSTLFGIDRALVLSMIPKSVTTPIGIEISNQIGGISSITVMSIIITGNVGVVMAGFLFRALKIEDEVAVGIAYGTAAHALGTSRAMEIGEKQGAMSSLSIGIAGLITVFITPLLIILLNI